MTFEEREQIFSKEVLSIEDMQRITGMDYNGASAVIRAAKRRLEIGKKRELRLDINGKIHMQDYLDAFDLPVIRYCSAELAERILSQGGRQ